MRLRWFVPLLALLLLVAGLDQVGGAALASPPAPEASPAAEPSPAPEASPSPSLPVTDPQKAAILAVLKELHAAYAARDVKAVMALIHEAVETTARNYQGFHPEKPGADQAIRDAFQAFHEDIFQHEGYVLLEFQPKFAEFKGREDGSVEVVSNVPILSTESMTFEDPEAGPTTVRLRLGRFVLRPVDGKWQIVEMDLF